jgi:tetratricopeptide (TPR) repeat protein
VKRLDRCAKAVVVSTVDVVAALPDPGQARTVDEIADQLRRLKVWAGDPSYETIKDRVNATWTEQGRPDAELARKSTVADCFKIGRRRLNAQLVVAVVRALHPDEGYLAQWTQALRVVGGETLATGQVRAQDVLPADLADFTGRAAELAQLREALHQNGDTVVISAIEGMAGVGKTQFAIHMGNLLAPYDQVLFVNLRGFHPDPGQPPADPAAVLDSFLRLLGVPGQDIPYPLERRAALYRDRLAGRRALVVLDNAADEAQVRPLLPNSPGCLTLITSRRGMAGLNPTGHVSLDVFTPEESLDYLTRAARVPIGDDPLAPTRIARRCGHLPLALGLLAGHVRTKPDWTLTDHADWLDERHRVRRLDTGVELALSLSYQDLPDDRRRVLRLLALHPGQDIDAYTAAALADTDLGRAAQYLSRLAEEHLLQVTAAGRFAFHDLVHAFALNQAGDADRPPERRAALSRLLDYYLYSASVAMDQLYPAEQDVRPRVEPPAIPTPALPDATAALDWLDAKRPSLLAVAGFAAEHGWPEVTVRLADILFRYLDGHFGDALAMHGHAREAARSSGNRAAEAMALNDLGVVYQRLDRHEQAIEQHQLALERYHELADGIGEAKTRTALGMALWHLGRYPEAAEQHHQALAQFRELGHERGVPHVLGNLASAMWRMGDEDGAAECYSQALAGFREQGDQLGEAHALDDLGESRRRAGRHDVAAEHHRQAIELYQELGERVGLAHARNNLARAYRELGRCPEAISEHEIAIAQFRELGNPSGEATALNSFGDTLLAAGSPGLARAQHQAALGPAVQADDRYERARAHDGIARTFAATEPDQARIHWKTALTLYTDLGVPEADRVHAVLAGLEE